MALENLASRQAGAPLAGSRQECPGGGLAGLHQDNPSSTPVPASAKAGTDTATPSPWPALATRPLHFDRWGTATPVKAALSHLCLRLSVTSQFDHPVLRSPVAQAGSRGWGGESKEAPRASTIPRMPVPPREVCKAGSSPPTSTQAWEVQLHCNNAWEADGHAEAPLRQSVWGAKGPGVKARNATVLQEDATALRIEGRLPGNPTELWFGGQGEFK